jgi:hypothetical protein
MPGILTVVVISQRPSCIFGAAKENFAENINNNTMMTQLHLFIICSFLPDPEMKNSF